MSDEFIVLLVMFSVSATINLGLAIAWFRASRRSRRLEERPAALGQLEDLPARVDSALEAIASRLDESASAQDFMNRVLTERLEKLTRALPPPKP